MEKMIVMMMMITKWISPLCGDCHCYCYFFFSIRISAVLFSSSFFFSSFFFFLSSFGSLSL